MKRPDDYQDPRPIRAGLSLFWHQLRWAYRAVAAGLYQAPKPRGTQVSVRIHLRPILQPPRGPMRSPNDRPSQEDIMGALHAQAMKRRGAARWEDER